MHNQFKTQKFKHLMLTMGPRDLNSAPYSPVHCSSHSMTSFQSCELTELPVVENSQLFAQRTVRPHGHVHVGAPNAQLQNCCRVTSLLITVTNVSVVRCRIIVLHNTLVLLPDGLICPIFTYQFTYQ